MAVTKIRFSSVPSFFLACYSRIPIVNMIFYRIIGNEPEEYLEKFYPLSGYPESEKENVLHDMEREFWFHGTHFDEYFLYDFYGKSREYKDSFINETSRFFFYNKLNTLQSMRLLDNKYKTYLKFKEFYRRDAVLIRNHDDFSAFRSFAEKYSVFVAKPDNGFMGIGVEIIHTEKENDLHELFSRLLERGAMLCEEYISQIPFFASFNPDSLNTVRIPTVLTGDNPENYCVHVFYPCLRNGRRGSHVDNGGSGGLFIQIDAGTGALYSVARDEWNHSFTAHPDTGVVYDGLFIPEWEKAVDIVTKLALQMPENRYVGWDMALTEKGWVLIEANGRAQFIVGQICHRTGKKKELEALLPHHNKKGGT